MGLFLLLMSKSTGQVTFQHAAVQETQVSPTTFLTVTIHNAGVPEDMRFEGEVLASSGELVLSFASDPVRVPAGISTLGSGQLNMRRFNYGGGELGRHVQLLHRLADGRYRYCVRMISRVAEVNDDFCEDINVEDLLFLDLVMPWDGDTIDDVRPALTWTWSGGSPKVPDGIRAVLVPKASGSTAAQAIASARPLFMVPDVRERTVAFPPGIEALERGRCYAWQVERLKEGRVLDRTAPWGFCVRAHKEPVHNKYADLSKGDPSGLYQAVDERIYFRYDEPYTSSRLTCMIHGQAGEQAGPKPGIDGLGDAAAGLRVIDVNLYELDLSGYSLKPGRYELVVRDEKGRARKLRFEVKH